MQIPIGENEAKKRRRREREKEKMKYCDYAKMKRIKNQVKNKNKIEDNILRFIANNELVSLIKKTHLACTKARNRLTMLFVRIFLVFNVCRVTLF